MPNEIQIIGSILLVSILGSWTIGAILAFFYWQEIKKKQIQIDKKTALMKHQKKALQTATHTIIELVNGCCPDLDLEFPDHIYLEIYDLEGVPEKIRNGRIIGKEQFVFALALKHLDGWCSYRKLYEAATPFNQKMKETGQSKITISQHFIRNTLEKYTFDPIQSTPIIGAWSDKNATNTEFFVLAFDIDPSGNKTRRLVSLAETVNSWETEKETERLFKGASSRKPTATNQIPTNYSFGE